MRKSELPTDREVRWTDFVFFSTDLLMALNKELLAGNENHYLVKIKRKAENSAKVENELRRIKNSGHGPCGNPFLD